MTLVGEQLNQSLKVLDQLEAEDFGPVITNLDLRKRHDAVGESYDPEEFKDSSQRIVALSFGSRHRFESNSYVVDVDKVKKDEYCQVKSKLNMHFCFIYPYPLQFVWKSWWPI